MPQQVTNTTNTGPSAEMWPWHQSLLEGAFNYAKQPYQQYQGPRVAGMSDIQYQALSGIQNQMAGNPMMQQAQGLLGGMMSGGPNPFMDQMIGDVTNQATRAYQQATGNINSRFRNPNSFAGSRHQMMQDQANESFARGLGGALGNLQYGAYGEGLDRQMRAAQLAQGLQGQQFSQLMQGLQAGSVPRGIQNEQNRAGYEDWQQARQYPREMIDMLNNILSGTRTQQQTTTSPGANPLNSILGGLGLLVGSTNPSFSFLGNY